MEGLFRYPVEFQVIAEGVDCGGEHENGEVVEVPRSFLPIQFYPDYDIYNGYEGDYAY